MTKNNTADDLSSVLISVSNLLQETGIQGIVIGGIAASILGRPRYTNDVDLIFLDVDNRVPNVIESLSKYDIEPRISDCEEFAEKSRMLLMRHVPTGINVDISMGLLPFEQEAVSRRQSLHYKGFVIPLPSAEDLIVFKSISLRPVDEQDIKAIVKRHPGLDKSRVLSIVQEFSDILEKPELVEKIETLLSDL